jgi:hypothetical protein
MNNTNKVIFKGDKISGKRNTKSRINFQFSYKGNILCADWKSHVQNSNKIIYKHLRLNNLNSYLYLKTYKSNNYIQ